jgi:hypothetical protein
MEEPEARSDRRYFWRGHASGEGGPILIADLEEYLSWGGAEARWKESAVYLVHSYGPLVRRLPARFQPQGPEEWHQNARIETLTAAQAYLQTLTGAVMDMEPSATLRDQLPMSPGEILAKSRAAFSAPNDPGTPARQDWLNSWRDHLEQGIDFSVAGERIFHVDLKPDTDYDRGCHAMTDAATTISFGEGCHGVLWDIEGGGTAELAVAEDHAGFLLLRTWVNDEQGQEEARKFAERSSEEKEMARAVIRSGKAVAVWSPVCPSDHVEGQDPGPWLRAAAEDESPVPLHQAGMQNIGILFPVQRGEYRVACGTHETEDWSCRWARFVRVSPLKA